MRIERSKFAIAAVVGAVLILAARVAWHASHAEVGWELIRHDWVQALAGFAGLDSRALSAQEPEDQARCWLREVERLRAKKGDPHVAAGAAWILDAPGTEFLQRHFRENKATQGFPGLPLGAHVELDHAAVGRAVARFEDFCHEHCTGLIEHATNIDAANVEMWRARALLLFQHEFLGIGFKPREPNWQMVLAECARHDPENALYDYLAALAEWKSAADHRWEQAGFVLDVRDQDAFDRGNQRFAAGLEKPRLMFGVNGYPDTVAFLENSSISRMVRLQAAESRAIGSRVSSLLYSLLRWQGNQQSAQRRDGEFAAAKATLRDTLQVARQVSITDNPFGPLVEPLILRRFALANLADLSVAAPGLFDPSELADIDIDRREIRLDLQVLNKAGERFNAKDHPQRGPVVTAAVTLAVIAQQFAAAILLMALCSAIIGRVCGKAREAESVRVSAPIHLAAWVAGLGLSFVVLGLCPAGLVSASVQTWIVRGLVAVPFVIALIGIVVALNRKFRVGYWQLSALSVSFALLWAGVFCWAAVFDLVIGLVGGLYPWATLLSIAALLGAVWFTIKADLSFVRRTDMSGRRKAWLTFLLQLLVAFTVPWGRTVTEFVEANLGTRIWVPTRVWSEAQSVGLTPDDLYGAMTPDRHPWVWSSLQWDAYHGFYVGLSFSLLLLIAWTAFRLSRAAAGGFRQVLRQGKIAYVRLISTIAARSLALAGTGALLVYLATVPAIIDEREAYYQRHYSRLVDPVRNRQELDAEIAAIRNDATLMVDLREKAEK